MNWLLLPSIIFKLEITIQMIRTKLNFHVLLIILFILKHILIVDASQLRSSVLKTYKENSGTNSKLKNTDIMLE